MYYAVHGILQARKLEWVAFPFSRESSQPRDRIQVSRIAGRFFTSWAIREAQHIINQLYFNKNQSILKIKIIVKVQNKNLVDHRIRN